MSMSLIQTVTVSGTTTNTVTFSSIPQDGTDLVILFSARVSNNVVTSSINMTLNDSSTGYTIRELEGSGSAVASASYSQPFIGQVNGSTSTANSFGNALVYIPNYTSAQSKTYSGDITHSNNASAAQLWILAGTWANTSAVTSLSFTSGTNFVAGSTFSLYKITKGSGGATVA